MQWIENTPIKILLSSSMLILGGLLISTMTYMIFYIYLPLTSKASNLNIANLMADHIITATVEQAKERGFTLNYLAMQATNKSYINRFNEEIKDFRQIGDSNIITTFELANTLTDSEFQGIEFNIALQTAENSWDKIKQLRHKIDGHNEIAGYEWFNQMSHLIHSLTHLRQTAFMHTNHQEITIYNNTIVKEAIWLLSEYAGRERAILASAIASSKPISDKNIQDLIGYRSIVDKQIKFLKLKVMDSSSNKHLENDFILTKEDWTTIEDNFLGQYQVLREKIYLASESGENYPVSSGDWLISSTRAIEDIIMKILSILIKKSVTIRCTTISNFIKVLRKPYIFLYLPLSSS